MKPRIVLLSLLLVLVFPIYASAQTDKFLISLKGDWVGEGKAFGGAALMRLKWEWVLNNKFLRLTLRNEISAPDGTKQIFEGQAYYRSAGVDKYQAHWFDSRGTTFPIRAILEGNTMTAWWGSPETEEGKSTYKLIDDVTMEVVDSVKQQDGAFREFARVTLKRL